ncbi:MAG TPA: AAA domain-containing protein, partial [Candidatus Kapabacteria bacterium]
MSIALPYFKYLRDVSRRIVQKSGFDNVFKGTAANPDCISLLTERRGQQWFFDAKKEADKADKQLFLGIGAIIGTAKTRGRQKRVGAPLFYVISELDADHSKLQLKRDTIIPNYDLIQHLIGFELETGEEDDQYARMSPSLQNLWLQLDRVTDIIRKLPLPEIIGSEKIEDLSTVFQTTIYQFISDLCLTNPGLRIGAVPNAQTTADLKARVKQQALSYSTDCFVFSAHFPDQLSTYSALQSLINQLEKGEAENELISRMVGNALRIPDIKLENIDIDRDAIRQAIKYVPFTLSSSQKAAIYNAWQSEVSYIQGPPGTGKSHTIAALMLTALFMGKKVLLVSQKTAAVNVVREKLSKLAAGSDLLMFISKDSEIKTSLRRDLDGIIQQSHQDRTHQALEETRRKHAQLLTRVNQSREKLADLRGKIKKMVGLQRDQYLANTDFLYSRSQLTNTFQTINPEFTVLGDTSARSWKKRVTKLHSISLLPPIVKQDALYLKTSKSFAKRLLKAEEKLLDVSRPQFPLYVQQLVACNLAFSTEQNFRNATAEADDINTFRRFYDDELKTLCAIQEQFVAATAELRKRELLASAGSRHNLRKFNGMLWNTDPNLIEPQMESIDYDHLTSAFPLWAGLIRDLGSYIPFKPSLFDLVIVDESSQVNTAEVLPAFYRGSRAC